MKPKSNHDRSEERVLWRSLMQAYDDDRTACAFELAREYTRLFPDLIYGWIMLAMVLRDTARYNKALRILNKVLKGAPKEARPLIFHEFGRVYLKWERNRDAEKWLRRSARLAPKATTLVFLGASLASQGKFSEAKRVHLRAAHVPGGDNGEPYLNVALILRAERKYVRALDYANRAIRLDREYKEAIALREDLRQVIRLQRLKQVAARARRR